MSTDEQVEYLKDLYNWNNLMSEGCSTPLCKFMVSNDRLRPAL